ncbi:VOC family protein [Jatrophihabitans endophyticus]|uniref:VOC family protein n=1 Tax=Jatrophihabitans endophyticus TaxID=1206085 RepID=UPI0019DBC4FD|nr:VOC family protein [Jatrophihabitans endophyticus]MBE7187963.1 VOC family protein [Jatrophihabitans endophyticus]
MSCARLDHVSLGAPEPAAVIDFYDAVLGALGLVRLDELVDEEEDDAAVEAAAWGPADGRAFLWVVTAPTPTTGLHVRLRAQDSAQVELVHRLAVRHGGRSHSAPRRWTLYRRGEFGTSVLDPLANIVEVVAPE